MTWVNSLRQVVLRDKPISSLHACLRPLLSDYIDNFVYKVISRAYFLH